jgi:hypothetical protein
VNPTPDDISLLAACARTRSPKAFIRHFPTPIGIDMDKKFDF